MVLSNSSYFIDLNSDNYLDMNNTTNKNKPPPSYTTIQKFSNLKRETIHKLPTYSSFLRNKSKQNESSLSNNKLSETNL